MPIDRHAAHSALEKLGARLGLTLEDTAAGVIRVVTANMARAIRLISVQRGYDPRDYCLMPFGGGGPVHAGRLARELGMERILVPRNPGILCALGLLLTDIRRDFSVTRRLTVEAVNAATILDTIAGLRADANAWFDSEGLGAERQRVLASADMRYAGQNYELNVPLRDEATDTGFIKRLLNRFAEAYERQYDYTAPDDPVEIVTFRIEAYGLVEKPAFETHEAAGLDPSAALIAERQVYHPETRTFIASPVYDRDTIRTGNVIAGPAVIEQMDSTTLVLPGQTAQVDAHLNLMIQEDSH
jgi:N-methylhydantoinase A